MRVRFIFSIALLLAFLFTAGLVAQESELPSVLISAWGKVEEGEYDEISITGSGKIVGDIIAREVRIGGHCEADANIEVEILSVSGTSEVKGNIKAGIFNLAGFLDQTGNLEIGEGELLGTLKVDGMFFPGRLILRGSVKAAGIEGGEIDSRGSIDVSEDIDLGSLRSVGSLNVPGTLSAERIEILLGGPCNINEIKGKKINVQLSKRAGRYGWTPRNRLTAGSIEGDEIYLERVTAGLVKGNNVKIGPGSIIDRVEYTDSIKVDPKAEVGEQVKMEKVIEEPTEEPQEPE
jgi:cytoskeletal protein CcmA (bactofilin family)